MKLAEKFINSTGATGATQLPQNLICFSHLRWDFVYQRPQHILTRLSKSCQVYFFEEPVFDVTSHSFLSISNRSDNLNIVTPHLPSGLDKFEIIENQRNMLDTFLKNKDMQKFAFWYYTPMALEFSKHLNPALVVYDCMDELSALKFAPPELKDYEQLLFLKANVVFTGGYTLYEAKKDLHKNIYPFPSSIDRKHFSIARYNTSQPKDQLNIPEPRIGFFGVIDERFDIDLIKNLAELHPEWHIVLIGPIIKVDPDTLPQNSNIHYLGQKHYQELPSYLSGWSVALIPFLLNESTRFISPTKTPEYLAAGIPVVSTPIKDVVRPYGENGMVHIGSTAEEFAAAICKELKSDKKEWLVQVDEFLKQNSWDLTCSAMIEKMEEVKRTPAKRINILLS